MSGDIRLWVRVRVRVRTGSFSSFSSRPGSIWIKHLSTGSVGLVCDGWIMMLSMSFLSLVQRGYSSFQLCNLQLTQLDGEVTGAIDCICGGWGTDQKKASTGLKMLKRLRV